MGDATTPGSIFFHWPGMKNEIITYMQTMQFYFVSLFDSIQLSFHQKMESSTNSLNLYLPFPAGSLRGSPQQISCFSLPSPLWANMHRAFGSRGSVSRDGKGGGEKRKSQEEASLTTLLPSPHISPDRTSLFALNPPLFLGSQFREREPIFVVRFDSAFPSAFLSKRNFWLFRQDQEKSATAAVSYPKPHCRLLPSLCVSQDWNNRGHKTGG